MTNENQSVYKGTIEDFSRSKLSQAGVCNVENRTIFCKENVDILQGINSDCIDLIYLDPPFNKNKNFTAPIGFHAEGVGFKDIFREEDLKEDWLSTIREKFENKHEWIRGDLKDIVNEIKNFKTFNRHCLCFRQNAEKKRHRTTSLTSWRCQFNRQNSL